MMNFIRNTSPEYKGNAQPTKNGNGGLPSQLLCYLFGGGTPSYKGQGQSAPKACGSAIFANAPVYKEPVVDVSTAEQSSEMGDEPELEDELDGSEKEPVEAMGKITIVVG